MHFVKFSYLGSAHSYAKVHYPIYPLNYLKPLNCSFAIFINDNTDKINIKKIKLDFTHAENLGPIYVDIITKEKKKMK